MDEVLLPETSIYNKKQLISLNKFIFLNLITFNIYSIWWNYKAWRFFQERHPEEELMPVWRTIFSILFIYSLFQRIIGLAHWSGYKKDYSAGYLLLGIIVSDIMFRLPDPYSTLGTLELLFFIPPFLALNYATENCGEYEVVIEEKYSTRQIILIGAGSILWLCQLGVWVNYYYPIWPFK